jgi:hypothetical protein
MVTVPEERLFCLTDQYWVKVDVPVMEGWLVRVSVQRGGAVRGDRAELGHAAGAGVEAAVVLDDVVLGLGLVDPAVDGEVRARATGRVGAGVGDLPSFVISPLCSDQVWELRDSILPGTASRPTKTGNDISAAAPLEGELAGAQVVLEASGTTVVVLNVVDSTRVTLLNGGNLLDGSGKGKAANQSDQSSSELHDC